MKAEVDAAHGGRARQAPGLERHGQGLGLDAVPVLGHVAAHHGADQRGAVEIGGVAAQHEAAVAEHGDPVGQGEDLGHAVGDVDDAHAVVAQSADEGEEQLLLGAAKGGGGLVQDQHLGGLGAGPGDLHHLALARRQRPGLPRGIERDAEPVKNGPGLCHHRGLVEPEPARPHRLAPDQQVLGHGPVGQDGEFLKDGMDACDLGLGGGGEAHLAPLEPHRARIGRKQARGDLHQGGLARAVLAHEGVDLARPQVEARAVEGEDARKALGDVAEIQKHGPPLARKRGRTTGAPPEGPVSSPRAGSRRDTGSPTSRRSSRR